MLFLTLGSRFLFCYRCDINEKLPRESNKVTIDYNFVIYNSKEAKKDVYSQEDTKPADHSQGDTGSVDHSQEGDTEPANRSQEDTKPIDHSQEDTEPADHSQEDTKPAVDSTKDVKESPSKKNTSTARQLLNKIASGVKAVGSGAKAVGKTIGKILPTFSKTSRHVEVERKHSHTIVVSRKGIDKKGNPRQSLSTTYLIRHVNIDQCDSVSISVTPTNCRLSEAHLFMRFM